MRRRILNRNRSGGNIAIYVNGDVVWYNDIGVHRTHGPAAIHATGYVVWINNNIVNRADGPASILPDGSCSYWINGNQCSPLEFFNLTGKS